MFDPKTRPRDVDGAPKSAFQRARGFAALDEALRRHPGHKLFTVLSIDWSRQEHRRVYTSSPGSYPCGGAKPIRHSSDFFQRVIAGRSARICRNAEECRAAFPDFELIRSLGCESAVNVPIRAGGVTVGSLNLLHERGWYTEGMLPTLARFASLAAGLLRARKRVPLPGRLP